MRSHSSRRAVRFVAAIAVFAIACGEAPPPQGLQITTSLPPLALLVGAVGGDDVEAWSLLPSGASPHVFDPVPGDVARLASSSLFVRVGGGLDDWLEPLLDAAPRLPVLELLRLPGLEPLAGDPHCWLDPLRVRDVIAPAIADRLRRADPGRASDFALRLDGLQKRLTALDAEIRATLAEASGRRYVAFHPAWRYFADRYDLIEVGVVMEFAGEEPTPRALVALIEAARAHELPAILVEPQMDPRVGRTLAAEFDAVTVTVDPLGDPSDPERASYEALMRWNARAFARALGGRAP